MSTHASGLNFVAFLRAEADAAEDKARRLRIQAAALTQTAGLGIGEWALLLISDVLFVLEMSCRDSSSDRPTKWPDTNNIILTFLHLWRLLSSLFHY